MAKEKYNSEAVRIRLQGDEDAITSALEILSLHQGKFTRFRKAIVIGTNTKTKQPQVVALLELPLEKLKEIISGKKTA